MKILPWLLLLLPAAASAAPAGSPATPSMAVFDFTTDGNLGTRLGMARAGPAIARVLRDDLSVLPPLAVVNRGPAGPGPVPERFDLDRPIPPAEAARIGRLLGATTLVSGQVIAAGSSLIIAARVVAAGTGEALGTMVKGDGTAPVAELVARLGAQIARIAMIQQGLEPVPWVPAGIVGTCRRGALLSHDEVACVMAVDGRAIPDEALNWSRSQALLPGVHEIFVRFYDGTATAGRSFVIEARPGAAYAVSYQRQPRANPTLWIQDLGAHQPATEAVEARMGEPAPAAARMPGDEATGYVFPPLDPGYVRAATPRTK